MFTISAKGAYGLYAMMELASAYPGGSLQIRDVAEAREIPQHYLEQLLVTLRKASFVKSFRGTNGGYALAKPPSEIRVLDILAALEGPVEILREQVPRGGLDFFWNRLAAQFTEGLTLTLEEIVTQRDQHRQAFTFVI
ncbi:MAG: Rrf2 family transcriptional regulator [Spirochaetales bacterium]|nr:Rrf2 family transcriptional regulator [Spirochaetales bacterium]